MALNHQPRVMEVDQFYATMNVPCPGCGSQWERPELVVDHDPGCGLLTMSPATPIVNGRYVFNTHRN